MLKIAVIGAGRWGPNLIRNFHENERSHLTWVVDWDQERLDQVGLRFPEAKLSRHAEPALDDDTVDAVVIATPPSNHKELVQLAIKRNKHVLVEKPFTTNSQDAEELCSLADEHGIVLMVGHVFIYNNAVRAIKQIIDRGDLGRIYYIWMLRTNLGAIRTDVSAAWDLAPHDISIANYWLSAEAVQASAMGRCWINPGFEDAVFATLLYPEDVLVNLTVSWLNPRKVRDITVVGEKKMLTFDDMNLKEPVRIYDKGVSDEVTRIPYVDTFSSFRSSIYEGDVSVPRIETGEPLRAQCDHFVECAIRGKRPETDGQDGLAVVRTLEAIDRCLRASNPVQVLQ